MKQKTEITVIVHLPADIPVLDLSDWIYQNGLRLKVADGVLHAYRPKDERPASVVPLRPQVPNPFGGAA